MPAFLDKLKEGAGKAAFEADRLRRLNQEQSVVRTLKRQVDAQTAEMGRQALTLFDDGSLTQPELLATCEKIDSLREEIAEQEAKIERIRQEKPPEAPHQALYGHICTQCRIELPGEARFCPRCGSQTVDVAPPSPPSIGTCGECGADLASEALFCSRCGAPVQKEEPMEVSKEAEQITCQNCQASIPAEADFCPICGHSVIPTPIELPQEGPSWESEIRPGQSLCPYCHTPIPDEAIFCPECGKQVVSVPPEQSTWEPPREAEATADQINCPHCSTVIPSEAIFCPECGNPIVRGSTDSAEKETPSAFVQIPVSLESEVEEVSEPGEDTPPHEFIEDESSKATEDTPHLVEEQTPSASEDTKPSTHSPTEETPSELDDAPPPTEPAGEKLQADADEVSPPAEPTEEVVPLTVEDAEPLTEPAEVLAPSPTEGPQPVETDHQKKDTSTMELETHSSQDMEHGLAQVSDETSPPPELVEAERPKRPQHSTEQPRCPSCDASIPAEADYCPACGKAVRVAPTDRIREAQAETRLPLPAVCPSCRISLPAEAVFCPECGKPVGSAPPEAFQHPSIERRSRWPTVCPSCRAPVPVEAVFCPECGARIDNISTKTA